MTVNVRVTVAFVAPPSFTVTVTSALPAASGVSVSEPFVAALV